MFENMKIGQRLGLGFGLILATMIVLIVTGIMALKKSKAELEMIVTHEHTHTQLANDMIINAQSTASDTRGILLLKYDNQSNEMIQKTIDHLADTRKTYEKNYGELKELYRQHGHKEQTDYYALLGTVALVADTIRQLQDKAIALALAGKMTVATAHITAKAFPVMQRWLTAMNILINKEKMHASLVYNEAQKQYAHMVTFMLGLGAFSLVLAIAVSIGLTRGITVPLKIATELVVSREQIVDISAYKEGRGELGVMIRAFSRDLTDRKLAEEILKNSERKYSLLFDEMLSGLAVHEIICDQSGTPTDYRFLSVNKAFEKITGLIASDILGKTVLEVMPGTESSWIERYGKVALTGEPTHFENSAAALGKHYEVRAYCPEHGKFATLINDITERKQAEESAKKEQALSNAIIESIPGTFYLLDETGQYVRWNAYQRDEIVGKPDDLVGSTNALDTIHPDDRGLIQSKIANVLTNGVVETIEGRVLLRGGPASRWLVMTGRRMLIDGRPFLVGIGIDITERKQAEEIIKTQLDELLRWHNATHGRESRILDLKHEVNELLGKDGDPPRYPSAETQAIKEE